MQFKQSGRPFIVAIFSVIDYFKFKHVLPKKKKEKQQQQQPKASLQVSCEARKKI